MIERTTPARWSQRLYNIQRLFNTIISNNPKTTALPSLHADDYDFYLESVLRLSPRHEGNIYYKGFEIRKLK